MLFLTSLHFFVEQSVLENILLKIKESHEQRPFVLGSLAWSGRIDEKAVVVDPIGAIIISIYIIIAWILQGNRK